jgi:hypothetical protein
MLRVRQARGQTGDQVGDRYTEASRAPGRMWERKGQISRRTGTMTASSWKKGKWVERKHDVYTWVRGTSW